MGNQLVGAAPAQIFPVEHYMSDIADLEFDSSLGSTRFLKVARAKHHSGLVVVKVFIIQDAGLNLKRDRDKLMEIKKVLEGNFPIYLYMYMFFRKKCVEKSSLSSTFR